MVSARPARPGFFPLDDELALLPGRVTPRLDEELVHLATWMPFAQAAKHLARSTRVVLSEPTVRRHTQAAGAAAVTLQTTAAAHILQQGTQAPEPPEQVVISVDGAMVPLRHGDWAEVKTLVVGEPDLRAAAGSLHHLSYFSRLTDATTFGDEAVVETQRRGVSVASKVAAVADGAEWIQGFIDLHCPGAVRILDFPHAVERLTHIAEAVFGAETAEAKTWLQVQCHALKHEGPTGVLTAVADVLAEHAVAEECQEHVAYLEKRVGQMQYPAYAAAGWPLGSGVVESANNVVMETRMKGAGMRWERGNVNPMLALRTIVYSDRWDEAWGQIGSQVRAEERARQQERREARRQAAERSAPVGGADQAAPVTLPPAVVMPAPSAAEAKQARGAWRPAADHPWKRAWSPRQQAAQIAASGNARL